MHVYVFLYVYMYIYLYIYIHSYAYTHTDVFWAVGVGCAAYALSGFRAWGSELLCFHVLEAGGSATNESRRFRTARCVSFHLKQTLRQILNPLRGRSACFAPAVFLYFVNASALVPESLKLGGSGAGAWHRGRATTT